MHMQKEQILAGEKSCTAQFCKFEKWTEKVEADH